MHLFDLTGDYVENILTPDDVITEMNLKKFKSILDLSSPILSGKFSLIWTLICSLLNIFDANLLALSL